MIQVLSSFAISVVANIVTSLFVRNDTEKDIRDAFQEAIEMWCPNEEIRCLKEKEISEFVNGYLNNPTLDTESLSQEHLSLLECLEKCVAKHQAATAYLSAIKGREYYNRVMASLNVTNVKLDVLSQKLDEANPKHEELHFEAVAEINTLLKEVAEDPVDVLLYGIASAFDEDVFAYTEVNESNIKVVVDKDSKLIVDEDGNKLRPKFQKLDYEWEKEIRVDWTQTNLDQDFWGLFEYSYIAAFQLIPIDLYEGIRKLQRCIDRKSINDQLSTEEKRLLNDIIVNMRALQAVVDDHDDVFVRLDDTQFQNLEIKPLNSFNEQGLDFGRFSVYYNDGDYKEEITELVAPKEAEDILLDVMMINPDYYYKITEYMSGLINTVVEWRKESVIS